MTEQIGAMLTAKVADILPWYLSEAEVESYPYAVYDQTVEEHRTKDGVYKYTADTYISVFSKSFGEADTNASAIRSAIDGLKSDTIWASFQTIRKDCQDGVWEIQLYYKVTQFK